MQREVEGRREEDERRQGRGEKGRIFEAERREKVERKKQIKSKELRKIYVEIS